MALTNDETLERLADRYWLAQTWKAVGVKELAELEREIVIDMAGDLFENPELVFELFEVMEERR